MIFSTTDKDKIIVIVVDLSMDIIDPWGNLKNRTLYKN